MTTPAKLTAQERADLERQIAEARAKLAADPATGRVEWGPGDRFQVTAPVIIIKMGTPDGYQLRHLYKGAFLPHDVADEAVEHHLNVTRQIAKVGTPAAEQAYHQAREEAEGRGEDPDEVGKEGAPDPRQQWRPVNEPETTGKADPKPPRRGRSQTPPPAATGDTGGDTGETQGAQGTQGAAKVTPPPGK